jgi:hypothetical protein
MPKRLQPIPNWRKKVHKLWSIRLALFWGAFCGLYGALSVLQDVIPWQAFLGLSVFMNVAIVVARLTHQPGVDDA